MNIHYRKAHYSNNRVLSYSLTVWEMKRNCNEGSDIDDSTIERIFHLSIQVVLIISGNLSFLNWLTILPGIYCLDDAFLKRLFPSNTCQEVIKLQEDEKAQIRKPLGLCV